MAKDEKKMKVLQRRRLRAGRLLLKGVPQAEVARRVGVSRATVCEWNGRLQQDGLPALRRRPRGRPAGLDATMRHELAGALKAGAMAHGFATELWTLARISHLIVHASTKKGR
jgi:transposase